LTDPSFLALQSAVAGRFSLESELGRGGMGIVFLARDVILERPVAIKLLAPSLAARADMRRRFLREARLAAQCFHPNIVPIHEVAEAGELAWFVMGYVPGETLADRLRRTGPLPASSIRRIGREIGWALAYAHERGVVHRDVKPENILLEQGTDRALIADFGIAVADSGPHASGEVAGTARFMAPEQALGEAVDGRADLYALGVTLYLAATGTYPFETGTALALVVQQSMQRAPSVRERAPALPPSLADAIDQCLAARPDERYDHAAAFVAALERTPDGGELPVDVRAARTGMASTLSLTDWTLAIAYASFFLVLGEEARSFGRAIMIGLVQGVLTFAAGATLLRGGETLLAARRALKQGVRPEDVAEALAPPPVPPVTPLSTGKAIALLLTGGAVAFGQAQIDLLGLPSTLELIGNVFTWIAPPLLVHRAIVGARYASGLSSWAYAFVRKPLAARVVGWLNGRRATAPSKAVPASAPTEVLLDRAAHDVFARLPERMQQDLRALPAATAALAQEAVALRARAQELSGALRAHRQSPSAGDSALAELQQEQAVVNARLATAITALEAIRLDLLRLDANRTLPGNLTDHLNVVRDLQHRVDANDDVRRLLEPLRPEPTPV
jgi:eukaryotic-like serine/threonine-protein kinase